MSRTHKADRKTRTITDHDGRRTRGVRRSDRRKDTRIWSGVVRGTRVGDPLGANGRSQPHNAEGLRQGSLIPPPATTSWAEVGSRSARRRQHSRSWPPAGAEDDGPLLDPGGATWRYALTTGWRRSARAHLQEEERGGGSEPGWASHDPHHRVLGGPHAPHPRSARGEEHQGERLAAMRRTVVGQRRVRER
jgi:hypothetical protein